MQARPIVKWAGGKWRLKKHLLARVPAKIATYAEPFVGGAALFLALTNEAGETGRRRFERAVLADANVDLVTCYRVVRDRVEALIEALRGYRYDRELFYATRERDPHTLSDVDRAARLLFLNRTCFNGLWRVNASGKFNVPFGRYQNPKILQEDRLRAASAALAGADVRAGDFMDVTRHLGEGDFVYFDPPYAPLSRTSDFTAYAAGGFGREDQLRLRDELSRLRDAGVLALLSNADTPETRELYADFTVHAIQAPRSIHADATKRGPTTELLVSTWDPTGRRRARKAGRTPATRRTARGA